MQTTTDSPKTMPAPSVGSGGLLATPRTDAAYYVVKNPGERGDGISMVTADFARELERENDRLRKVLDHALRRLERLNAEETGPCDACEAIRRILANQ